MELDRQKELITRIQASTEPAIEFLSRAEGAISRVGVFASSFNPITSAHVELMHRASHRFGLQETLALAGVSNADKSRYECSLEDRVTMLLLTLKQEDGMSIGISSHAYFVDVTGALERSYPAGTEFYFIVGSDTFERVLDREGRYTPRYHRTFADRSESLRFLLEHARLVVAGRAGSSQRDVGALVENDLPDIAERILYIDLPPDIAAVSASEVRERVGRGQAIAGLVPPAVETYIVERGIYKKFGTLVTKDAGLC